jgi:hypothetical protein
MPLNYRYNTLVKGTRGEWVEVNDADGTMLGDEYSGKTMYVISIYTGTSKRDGLIQPVV